MEKEYLHETHYTLDVVVNGWNVIPIFYKASSDGTAVGHVMKMIGSGLINSDHEVNGDGYLEGRALSLMNPKGENLPIKKDLTKRLSVNTIFELREALHGI